MTVVYIYNLLLIILYAVTATLSFYQFFREKDPRLRKIFLTLMIFTVFFILDNWLVSMTELISSFASYYNKTFNGISLVKTLIFTVHNFCLIYLLALIKKEKISIPSFIMLGTAVFWMLAVSLFPDSSLKVYLYYLPNQLFLLYSGLVALLTPKSPVRDLAKKYLRLIGLLSLFFGLAILLEDSFVIFYLDNYDRVIPQIQNRNFNEDLFTILSCLAVIYFLLKDYPAVKEERPLQGEIEDEGEALIADFCQTYRLTAREEEILNLLLESKHNQEIADQLFLSLGTVKTHIHNIYIKLDIRKRKELLSCYQAYRKKHHSKG